MTPSAYRLLGLIQERSKDDSVYWTRLQLSQIAEYFNLSERTIRRAKSELDGYGLVKFRTISNGSGKGHKVYACLPHKLVNKRGELLHSTRSGKARISRTKVGGRVINKPKLNDRPRDTTNTIGSLREHQYKKNPTVRQGLERKPTSKQVALAHWLKRELWKRHSWDNCKVMKSDAHAFGFALRAIKAGFDISEIHKAFAAALRTMHGTATDVGLMTGSQTQTLFCLSSTVSLATRLLKERGRSAIRYAKRMLPNLVRHRSDTDPQKAETLPENPTKGTIYRRSTAPIPCQSARFASIMDALN
jgi:hypothetical protein